mgnify:CR=1 FL=1
METIEIKKQIVKFNKILCRNERDYLVEKLKENTQSERIKNLKGFLNNFNFDKLSTTKN